VRFQQKGQDEETLPIKGAFVYLQGGRPITDFLQDRLELNDGGCIVVDSQFRTALPGVYAVGDVLCNHVKQVVIAAGEGAVAGMALEKARNAFINEGLPVQTELLEGEPADTIIKYALEQKIDNIIIGQRGLGALKSFVLGSVSQKVLHNANIPVTIIK